MTSPLFCTSRPRGVIYAFESSRLIKPWIRLSGGASSGGAGAGSLASGSPPITGAVTAKDSVQAMSAAEIKREHRAPNVALMRCELFGYMPATLAIGVPDHQRSYNMFVMRLLQK